MENDDINVDRCQRVDINAISEQTSQVEIYGMGDRASITIGLWIEIVLATLIVLISWMCCRRSSTVATRTEATAAVATRTVATHSMTTSSGVRGQNPGRFRVLPERQQGAWSE